MYWLNNFEKTTIIHPIAITDSLKAVQFLERSCLRIFYQYRYLLYNKYKKGLYWESKTSILIDKITYYCIVKL
jgi:hypothetical protein